MNKNAEIKLDKRDRKLLYLLDLDGRTTYSKLAKSLGMSKQLVKYRIERLERIGIIKGYFPMVDMSRLGTIVFRVYIKFKVTQMKRKKEITNYFRKNKFAWAVVPLVGKWDLAVAISVKNILDFHIFWDEVLKDHLNIIKDYATFIYSPVYHYSKSYIINQKDKSKIRVLGNGERTNFDNKDINILQALSENARLPLIEIAKKVNLSAELTSYRIKQMEKKGLIQGYRALIDVRKLGYRFFKTEIRLSNYNKIKEIMQFCHQHPNIYQLNKVIGGETLEIEFHVKDIQVMLDIFDEFERLYPLTFEYFDYIEVLSEDLMTYIPRVVIE